MITVKKLTLEDWKEAYPMEGMELLWAEIGIEHGDKVVSQEHSYVARDDQGHIISIFGIVTIWENRGEMWSFFTSFAKGHAVSMVKEGRKLLHKANLVRIEATGNLSAPWSHKWFKVLGFKKEASCLSQYRNGNDYALYSYIKAGG